MEYPYLIHLILIYPITTYLMLIYPFTPDFLTVFMTLIKLLVNSFDFLMRNSKNKQVARLNQSDLYLLF